MKITVFLFLNLITIQTYLKMAEENMFLTTQNNVLIEKSKENSSIDYNNLLNPDREVNKLTINIFF